jgi:hypothetical protein
MKQMVNTIAPCLMGQLGLLCERDFFRLKSGAIFMRGLILSYPISINGEVLSLEPFSIRHEEMVEKIDPADLGINPEKLRWCASRVSP